MYGVVDKIGNKLMGMIDIELWKVVCKEKFKYYLDGWQMVMIKIILEWENRIGD